MDLIYIPTFMFGLYIIDKFVKKDNIRWFVLHTITNLLVIISAFPDMFNILINPLHLNNIGSICPRIFTIGLHAYHIAAFKKIEFIDYVHHILMIGALFTTYYYEDLNLTNYFLFYMTGLTGMIDYFMLVLVKLNMIHKITEKDINSKLNNYVRYPLIINGMSTLYFRYYSNLYDTSLYPILGLLLVFFWNGSYFNYRVIENYGKSRQELDTIHEV
jgi:hypothetical protein